MSHGEAFSDIRPVPDAVRLSWPAPNYIDPEKRGPALLIVNCLLLPIALVVVGLRLYTRLVVVRSAGLDDLFITLALVPAIGLTVAVCLAASKYSWDVHIWDMPPSDVVPGRQVTFAAQLLFLWATSLTKVSILLFYRRMSGRGSKNFLYYAVWATIAFVTCYAIALTIGLVAACSPTRAFWDLTVRHKCINERLFEMIAAIINIILDFVIILIPLPTVWSLHLPKKQKYALSGVFMIGLPVCVAGTVRMYYIHVLVNETYDITWEGFILWIFVAVEVDVALICASAPTLKPLFKRYFNGSTMRSTSHEAPRHGQSKSFGNITMVEAGAHPPESVELEALDNRTSHRTTHRSQTSTSHVAPNQFTAIGNKEDSESEESIFVLQQGEGGLGNVSESRANRGSAGGRSQAPNGARREPWESV